MKPVLVKPLIVLSSIVLAWGALTYGTDPPRPDLQPGDVADRDYVARRSAQVVDQLETERRREEAAAQVETITRRVPENETQVYGDVEELIAAVRAGVLAPEPSTTTTSTEPIPTTTTTTAPPTTGTTEGGEASTTTQPEQALLEGFVFVDVDGDGRFEPEASPEEQWRPDFGLANARVSVAPASGPRLSAQTLADGTLSVTVPVGRVTVELVDLPRGLVPSVGSPVQTVDCMAEDCMLEPVGLTPNVRPIDDQVADLVAEFPLLDESTLRTLAVLATQDVVREAAGQEPALDVVLLKINETLTELFAEGVTSQNVNDVKARVRSDPPFFNIDGERNDDAREAVADIIAVFLVPNRVPDGNATEQAREEARASVEPVVREYEAGDLIARQGERLTSLQIDAIQQTGAAAGENLRTGAMAALLGVLVGTLSFYLSRFRPQVWSDPRMLALWALLIVLGAGAVRVTGMVADRWSWYVFPGVAFGYLAAVLFDNRMGTLMALSLGILTAVGTFDAGAVTYAVLSTLAPIGFVSKVSSRRAFRNSVIVSSAAAALIAGVTAWFFGSSTSDGLLAEVGVAAAWGFGAAMLSALVALAAMPFFESMFDITTTLRLLELTDRNHEALQLLQERAFGTFNHSLMVGTLADAAARAIGANNLLARAAAYYHDLGKTENPLYFIENQFGVPNPHDELDPEESAEIIRRHVVDGVRLANRYGIPSEVAEGILTHHGDGIMRYFYEKARQLRGDADPDRFRHAGYKPKTKEMAILMMADSVEAACRAVFGEEEPSPDAIRKVVDRVIEEKLQDGQLSEADLTLAELTRIKKAFIDTLVGHYHQRINYPNFPGS